jgi:hypothetical protein
MIRLIGVWIRRGVWGMNLVRDTTYIGYLIWNKVSLKGIL